MTHGDLIFTRKVKGADSNGFYLSLDYLLSEFESSYLPVRATRATQLHECMIKCTLCSLKKFIEQCYVCEQHLGWGCRLRRVAISTLRTRTREMVFNKIEMAFLKLLVDNYRTYTPIIPSYFHSYPHRIHHNQVSELAIQFVAVSHMVLS